MANYPSELAQDAVYQSHTGCLTGLWFMPRLTERLTSNNNNNNNNNNNKELDMPVPVAARSKTRVYGR